MLSVQHWKSSVWAWAVSVDGIKRLRTVCVAGQCNTRLITTSHEEVGFCGVRAWCQGVRVRWAFMTLRGLVACLFMLAVQAHSVCAVPWYG